MSEPLPSVTVIIAARPEQAEIAAVAAARRLDYPSDRLDILLARGRQPSVQRNAAINAARGDWIYFLDDDSVPRPDNLRRARDHMADPKVKMVGGPNLCPPEAPFLEQMFAVILASWLPFGPSRARYAPLGSARAAGEKELILCNLMARRTSVLALGGFNESLYPNEENALMDQLRDDGGKLIYDPEFVVHRRPRRSLRSFVRMLLTYGRGRAEQFRAYPTWGSALNFIPPLFCVYLAGLIVLLLLPATAVPGIVRGAGVAPLVAYIAAALIQTIASAASRGVARSIAALPLLIVSPLLYGAGFWHGLFTAPDRAKNREKADVRLEKVAFLNSGTGA